MGVLFGALAKFTLILSEASRFGEVFFKFFRLGRFTFGRKNMNESRNCNSLLVVLFISVYKGCGSCGPLPSLPKLRFLGANEENYLQLAAKHVCPSGNEKSY